MVFDHGLFERIETITILKFNATCLGVLERVQKTGEPIRVTRFGKLVADVVPPGPPPVSRTGWERWRGRLAFELTSWAGVTCWSTGM